MQATRERLREKGWLLYFPQLVPLLLIGLKAMAHPHYNLTLLGFDLAFVAVAFDVWAFQTLSSFRMVAYGGYFDYPRGRGRQYLRHEVSRLVVALIVELYLLFAFAHLGATSPPFMLSLLSLAVAVGVPALLITGTFLPSEFLCE